MANTPTTIFTLGEALDSIITLVTAFERGRAIIIDSLNAFQTTFVEFVASQQNYNTSVTGQISVLAGKIDSLNTSMSGRMDRLESGLDDLNSNVTRQMAGVSSDVDSLVNDVTDL